MFTRISPFIKMWGKIPVGKRMQGMIELETVYQASIRGV